jgi:hypothetical protein
MSFSYDKSWDTFEQLFSSKLPFPMAWNSLIEYHEQLRPAPYWNDLRELDSLAEQASIADWLNEACTKNPLPDSVKALWIGIALLYDEESNREFYAYYLQGADSYEAADIEWATEPTYEPEEKYYVSATLNQLREIISVDAEQFSFLDWLLPLAFSSLLFDEIIRTKLRKETFVHHGSKLFVSLGFDGGDFQELTPVQLDNGS